MTIERYVHVDGRDVETSAEYDTMQEAIDAAPPGHAVVARIYEYADSELVWTPDGSDTWPRRPTRKRSNPPHDETGLTAVEKPGSYNRP